MNILHSLISGWVTRYHFTKIVSASEVVSAGLAGCAARRHVKRRRDAGSAAACQVLLGAACGCLARRRVAHSLEAAPVLSAAVRGHHTRTITHLQRAKQYEKALVLVQAGMKAALARGRVKRVQDATLVLTAAMRSCYSRRTVHHCRQESVAKQTKCTPHCQPRNTPAPPPLYQPRNTPVVKHAFLRKGDGAVRSRRSDKHEACAFMSGSSTHRVPHWVNTNAPDRADIVEEKPRTPRTTRTTRSRAAAGA